MPHTNTLIPPFAADVLDGNVGRTPPVMSRGATFGLAAGGPSVSQWKTRGQPAVAERA